MRVRAKPLMSFDGTRLRPYPHPSLRGTFSRGEKELPTLGANSEDGVVPGLAKRSSSVAPGPYWARALNAIPDDFMTGKRTIAGILRAPQTGWCASARPCPRATIFSVLTDDEMEEFMASLNKIETRLKALLEAEG
ncbi:MAG TPA: hypothetical protein DDZ67_12300 [Xanthomonadaceae bacterium]|nr:hypothetical protein [Xanthomonadaceae bacterium]